MHNHTHNKNNNHTHTEKKMQRQMQPGVWSAKPQDWLIQGPADTDLAESVAA